MRTPHSAAALALGLFLVGSACSTGVEPLSAATDASTPFDGSSPNDLDGSPPIDGSTPTGVVALSADETDVQTFQALFVSRADRTPFSAETYSATLGETELSLVVVDGKLVLTVPPGVQGAVELRVQLGSSTGLLRLNVQSAPQLPDPTATMTMVFSELRASLEVEGEFIADRVAAGELPATASDAHGAWLSSVAALEADFLALTPSDQQLAAQYIAETLARVESNLQAGDELVTELGTLSYADQQAAKGLLLRFGKHVLLFTSPAVIGGLAGGAPGAVLGVAFAKIFLEKLWMAQFHKAVNTWEQLANLQLQPIDLIMTEFKADVSFASGLPVPVSLDVTWRNAQAVDASDSTSWLEAALATIKAVNAVVVRFFENTEGFVFAPVKSSDEDPHALSAVQIVDISNPTVTCALSGTASAPTMTCNSTAEGVTAFTFRVRYQADEVTLTTPPISGEVEHAVDVCVDATAPVISGVFVTCGEADELAVDVSFTASAPGALVGSGFGACDAAETCYPSRLYFLSTGAQNYEIAANSYDAWLQSGTVNGGVIRLAFVGKYCDGKSGSETLKAYYNHDWKVQLMNECNQRSAEVGF